MIYLDASALKSWGCRELYRNQFVENIAPLKPNVYYELGKAVHLGVEEFWKGSPYEKAMDVAYQLCNSVRVDLFNPQEAEHWRKQVESLPDLIAAYYDGMDYSPENLLWVEKEWSMPFHPQSVPHPDHICGIDGENCKGSPDGIDCDFIEFHAQVVLCGRMDRVMIGPKLVDVKTASEISRLGVPWKKQYREEKLLDPQFQLYDWYLQQQGTPAKECTLEVIIKPYRGSKARLELIQLPEILTEAYRKRFRQQLAWHCAEIAEYHRHYLSQKPWPMNSNMCSNKYGTCPMAPICTFGMIPRVAEQYGPRQEHLEVRK